MILITPDDGPDGLTEIIDSVQQQLSDMRVELDRLYRKIQADELDELSSAGKQMVEIRQWLKIAIEAEVHLEKRRKEKEGIVHDYAIKLDEAKSAIGRKLEPLPKRKMVAAMFLLQDVSLAVGLRRVAAISALFVLVLQSACIDTGRLLDYGYEYTDMRELIIALLICSYGVWLWRKIADEKSRFVTV